MNDFLLANALFLADGNRLRTDMLEGGWVGDGTQITWITRFSDWFSTLIISATGALILFFAMSSFVFKLLYISNRKAFDKINECKKARIMSGASIRDSFQNKEYGILITFISMFPLDVKDAAFNDEEESLLSTKTILYKHLPATVFLVMIGGFIYNSHYRNFIIKMLDVSDFFAASILSVDAVGVFIDLTGVTGMPDFKNDGVDTPLEKYQNTLAKDLYKATTARFSEDFVTDETKTALANLCDSIADAKAAEVGATLQGSYEFTNKVAYTINTAPIKNDTDKEYRKHYTHYIPVSELAAMGSGRSGKETNGYFSIRTVARKSASKVNSLPIRKMKIYTVIGGESIMKDLIGAAITNPIKLGPNEPASKFAYANGKIDGRLEGMPREFEGSKNGLKYFAPKDGTAFDRLYGTSSYIVEYVIVDSAGQQKVVVETSISLKSESTEKEYTANSAAELLSENGKLFTDYKKYKE